MLRQHPRLKVLLGLNLLLSQPEIFGRHCRVRRRRRVPHSSARKDRPGQSRSTTRRRPQRSSSWHCLVSSQWQRHSLGLRRLPRQSMANPGWRPHQEYDWTDRWPSEAPAACRPCPLASFCTEHSSFGWIRQLGTNIIQLFAMTNRANYKFQLDLSNLHKENWH